MARRLAREEGILSGVSCGAAMAARCGSRSTRRSRARRSSPCCPDPGERYLSGPLFEGLFAGVETMQAEPAQAASAAVRRRPSSSSTGCSRATGATRAAQHINRRFLPSRDEILEIVQLLLQLFYPGYVGRQDLTDENLAFHVGTLLSTLREKLQHEIETCLCFAAETEGRATGGCTEEAHALTAAFLERLPAIRDALILDVQAAYDGDPAASSLDEVILAYPGLLAITVYRVAHELHPMGVPLMPRIMTEWAHSHSGADIHPGARIGRASSSTTRRASSSARRPRSART